MTKEIYVECPECHESIPETRLMGYNAKWFCPCGADIDANVVAAFAKREEASASSIKEVVMSEQISFTGHRHLKYKDVVSHLESIHRDHPNASWIVGGAVGLDSHAAEFAMSHGIKFSLILPFPSPVMTKFWSPAQRDVLARSVKQCSHLSVLAPAYDKAGYQARNVRMVDMSDMLVAFFDGSPGGTANCVRYAQSVNKSIVRFNGKEEASASSPAYSKDTCMVPCDEMCHECSMIEVGAPASSSTSEHDRRIVQAAKELKAAMSQQTPAPYNFEWEAHMDCLLAPPEQPQEERQPSPSSEKEVTFTKRKTSGKVISVYFHPMSDPNKAINASKAKNNMPVTPKKVVKESGTLVPLEHQKFTTRTIFPPEFPAPVVCQEFCDKTARCHLRQNGIGDLCKSSGKFGKLVHRVNLKWSAWHEFRTRLPKTELVHSTRTHGDVPEIALAHWGSPDAQMNDNGANGNDEYASPAQQAREFGDRDAVGFIPAFIFGPGKPEWRAIIVSPKNGIPYTKLVKYPSIRAIACRVKLQNGYVVPVGKFGSVVKITTRADKKRMRAYSAIRKELTQYVGADRAAKMAGQQVAAMASC